MVLRKRYLLPLVTVFFAVVFQLRSHPLFTNKDTDKPSVVERVPESIIRVPTISAANCPTDGDNDTWQCAATDSIDEVYPNCKYDFYAYFYSPNTTDCSSVFNFKYFLEVNGIDHSEDTIVKLVPDTDRRCCIVYTSSTVKKDNNTFTLLARNFKTGKNIGRNCTTVLKVDYDTLGPVKDLQAIVQSCEYINITWSAPNILPGNIIDGYYVTIKELNIVRLKLDNNETQFLFPYNRDCNKTTIYDCYDDLNFTVTVEPSYCGGIGNASSTTTITNLQISPEVEYIVSEGKNESQVIVKLQAKLDAGCASKINVSVVFESTPITTDNGRGTIKMESKIITHETLPITVMSQNYVSTTIELEVNQICYGTLEWIHNGEVVQAHHVVIRVMSTHNIPYELQKGLVLQSNFALVCCSASYTKGRHQDKSLVLNNYCQVDSDSVLEEDFCMETSHPCSDHHNPYFVIYSVHFDNVTILPSTSAASSMITSSHSSSAEHFSSPSESSSCRFPPPTVTPDCEPPNFFAKYRYILYIVGTSIFWIIIMIITIFILYLKWKRDIKICCRCGSSHIQEQVDLQSFDNIESSEAEALNNVDDQGTYTTTTAKTEQTTLKNGASNVVMNKPSELTNQITTGTFKSDDSLISQKDD